MMIRDPQACRPQTGGTRRLRMLTPTYCQPIRRTPMSWSHPLWTTVIKVLTIFPKRGTHGLEGMSSLCPLCWQSSKSILFYFTQNLSLRYDSAPVCREAEPSASLLPHFCPISQMYHSRTWRGYTPCPWILLASMFTFVTVLNHPGS